MINSMRVTYNTFENQYFNFMKRILILFIVFSCFTLSNKLNSQNFGGGMYGGIATSQISGDRLAGFNKPGINVGIFTNYSFNESLKLQLELSFIQKGSRDNANPDKGDYESYLLRLNYIEIPVLMNYKVNKFFSFEAGPYVAYLLGFSENDFYGEIPGSKAFNKYDLGITGSMHYIINENLDAVFRVSNSLLPVRDHKGGGTYRLNRGQYNSVVSLGLHYIFRSRNEQTI